MNIPDMPLQGYHTLLLDDRTQLKALCSVVNQSGRLCVSLLGAAQRASTTRSGLLSVENSGGDDYEPWEVFSPPVLIPINRVVLSRALSDDDPVRQAADKQQRMAYAEEEPSSEG